MLIASVRSPRRLGQSHACSLTMASSMATHMIVMAHPAKVCSRHIPDLSLQIQHTPLMLVGRFILSPEMLEEIPTCRYFRHYFITPEMINWQNPSCSQGRWGCWSNTWYIFLSQKRKRHVFIKFTGWEIECMNSMLYHIFNGRYFGA